MKDTIKENTYLFAAPRRVRFFIGMSVVGFAVCVAMFLLGDSGFLPVPNNWGSVLLALFFAYQLMRTAKTVIEIRIDKEWFEVTTIFKTFKYSRLSLKEIKNEPKFSNVLVVIGEKKEKYDLGSAALTNNRAEWERSKKTLFEDCA